MKPPCFYRGDLSMYKFRNFSIFLILIIMLIARNTYAETTNYRTDLFQETWQLHPDKTYELDIINKKTALTPLGVDMLANEQMGFFPDKERLQLVESYIIQPDGQRVQLPAQSVYTRPSPLSLTASGFTNSMITTVIFPKLQPGSQRVTHWKLTRFKADPFGITITQMPAFEAAVTREEVIIHKPNALNLKWGKRGKYQIATTQSGQETIIHAWLENKLAESEEVGMTDEEDFQSLFAASSTGSWEELGRVYYQLANKKSTVTPEIQTLAKKIVGNETGLAAAKLLYNWTTANIHYVQLAFNEAGAYTPHSASEILSNGYGDCKDYATLLQALLKAVGIKSYAVLINWGNVQNLLPVPMPVQFNHAILYLPDYHLFANPTDQTASFGVLDKSLLNKLVVIGSEKGEATYSPKGIAEDNQYNFQSDITLQNNGEITGKGVIKTTGILNNKMRAIIKNTVSIRKLADTLLADTPEGGTGNITSNNPQNLNQDMMMEIQWKSPFAFNLSPSIYFTIPTGIDYFSPNQLRHFVTYTPRQYPAMFMPAVLTWKYTIHLPAGYQCSALPQDVKLTNFAGSYESVYTQKDNTLYVTRKLVVAKNYLQPSEYEYFNQLMFKLVSDTRSTVVLTSATAKHKI